MRAYFGIATFVIMLFSCGKENLTPTPPPTPVPVDTTTPPSSKQLQSGVVISFDDAYVEQWMAAHNEISKTYDWKATFFVSNTSTISDSQFEMLKTLKEAGHEIAGHGYMHRDAKKFVEEHGFNSYKNVELNPMIEAMAVHDLSPTTFAYPHGARTNHTDQELLKTFNLIRGTSYRHDKSPEELTCYYKFDKKKLLYGLGIDMLYNNSAEYIESVLQHAKDNNYVVIFYGHSPLPNAGSKGYQTSYETLLNISKFITENHMQFYNFSDLYDLVLNNE